MLQCASAGRAAAQLCLAPQCALDGAQRSRAVAPLLILRDGYFAAEPSTLLEGARGYSGRMAAAAMR